MRRDAHDTEPRVFRWGSRTLPARLSSRLLSQIHEKGCGFGRGASSNPLSARDFLTWRQINQSFPALQAAMLPHCSISPVEQSKVPEVEQDLVKFQQLYDESADLKRLVRSPVIAGEDQARALSAVLDKAGVGALSKNFFSLVARNRRLFAAPDMARAFQQLAAKARGEVTAVVDERSIRCRMRSPQALKAALKQMPSART